MNRITTMVWLVSQSQTFWSVKSSVKSRSTAVNKDSGYDEIPAELFQLMKSVKDDAIMVLQPT